MKYIKRFNESLSDIENYCTDGLSYLLDDSNCRFSLTSSGSLQGGGRCYNFILRFRKPVKWLSISDDVIPFFQRLDSEYLLRKDLDDKCILVYYIIDNNEHPESYSAESYSVERLSEEDLDISVSSINFSIVLL